MPFLFLWAFMPLIFPAISWLFLGDASRLGFGFEAHGHDHQHGDQRCGQHSLKPQRVMINNRRHAQGHKDLQILQLTNAGNAAHRKPHIP